MAHPLAVDVSGKALKITPAYYVFRHISQYADPGGKVVGTSGFGSLARSSLAGIDGLHCFVVLSYVRTIVSPQNERQHEIGHE